MAFSKLDLPIKDIRNTENIGDSLIKFNNNYQILTNKIEEIVNELELDLSNKKIGVDNAIKSHKLEDLIIDNGSITFQIGTQNNKSIIATLINNNGSSQLTVDDININNSVSTTNTSTSNLTSTTSSSLNNVEISNKLTNKGSRIESFQKLSKNLVDSNYDSNVPEITVDITLTETSRYNNFITLVASDSNIYSSGNWQITNGTIIKIRLNFDNNNPPIEGQNFNFTFVRIEDNNGNDITSSFYDSNNINGEIKIIPNNNIDFIDASEAKFNISNTNYEYKASTNLMYITDNNTDYLFEKYSKNVDFS